MIDRRISIAPMMDYTDKHFRYFLRLMSKRVLLYTEMITADAIIHGDQEKLLAYDDIEHPLAIQLGGSDPVKLAAAAKIAEGYHYDEVNLNIGCPSNRVQSGLFGACLMANPDLVADCVKAMCNAVNIPVTVKTRIGIDKQDHYEQLSHFMTTVADAGCEVFIIHARKAWLKGLNPKQNREIPPLRYDVVKQLKQDFPQLTIILNGGIKDMASIALHNQDVDGVMIGRAAYENPYILTDIENYLADHTMTPLSRHAILAKFIPYVASELNKGHSISSITRHILGLFKGIPGARAWRRHICEQGRSPDANTQILHELLPAER